MLKYACVQIDRAPVPMLFLELRCRAMFEVHLVGLTCPTKLCIIGCYNN